ncbi:MAG: DUF1553 domain-containing protein [Opitutaceae bacterium]|nr:DUF1553 domain-containing protein [Opitutaceae bacterium]
MRSGLLASIALVASAACISLETGCAKNDSAAAKRGAEKTASVASTTAAALPATSAPALAKLSFNEHIQPILSDNCYACHGLDKNSRKGELRLDRGEFAFAKRKDSGPAIIPGKPDESPLVQRIESKDEKKTMPPPEAHKTLTAEQVTLLRRWIAEGAEYQEHWAFLTPTRPPLPNVSGPAKWRQNPIDRFVLARMQRESLSPSPEEERRTLMRRVTLDLTGLPPTAGEVDTFVADTSPDAYEKVVDRLLASSRYGEHRARYWLDYVRYADTHGIHIDNYRAIWPYRDYVIRAFNANKSFDQFVREQLAGDLLPARTIDEFAATGFMRCNLTTNEGGTVPEEVFVNQTRDRVEAFGATFLGLTTGCAACHDHKFDPILQRDFYGLAAFLSNTVEKPWDSNIAEPAPVLRVPKDINRAAAEAVLGRRAELQARLDARRAQARELIANWIASGKTPRPVETDALELRLKLDEAAGDVVKNSAPSARIKTFKADTNPLIWGENSWLWSSMRMDIFTRLNLGGTGDVEAGEKFSAGGWIMLRAKPGGGVRTGTGSGSLLARMGDEKRHAGAGWDLYHENLQLTVTLAARSDKMGEMTAAPAIAAVVGEVASAAAKPPAKKAAARAPMAKSAAPAVAAKRAIQVTTKAPTPNLIRDEWVHMFFTYDGSRKAAGVKLYVNGRPVETEVKLDSLGPKDSIRTEAAMHLGRRDDYLPMRETRFQDVRFYRRMLPPDEVVRLPFEDVAAEIVAREPDPKRWTTDEAFVAAERFYLGEIDAEANELMSALAAHDAAFDALTKDGPATLVAVEKSTPAYSDVLKRGDYYSRTQRVEPGTPHFLPPLPDGAPRNRRGLAEWLVSPEHPLLARVTVNRAWQELFGRGMVDTSGDFGVMGTRPSHPELLDWLAVEFRENGWDVKKLYRSIVTSATYRQSAVVTPDRLAKDPANRYLWRGPRFRMDAEMLRDSALAVSGLLVEKIGGPSVKPYQPPGLWEEVAMPESNTKTYVPDKGDNLYRRSVYTFWKRSSPPPGMETFDAPSREGVCPRRARTNTPLQAFVTMNDPQWIEAARKLAERTLRAEPDDAGRSEFMARVTLGRPLNEREAAAIAASAKIFREHFTQAEHADDVKALLAIGESKCDEQLDAAELAPWMLVASQFLNLDEFLTK